jgi:hypothetical protein
MDAEITFVYYILYRMLESNTIGTGWKAEIAANAQFLIDVNKAFFIIPV